MIQMLLSLLPPWLYSCACGSLPSQQAALQVRSGMDSAKSQPSFAAAALLGTASATAAAFRQVDPMAANLLAPYIAWLAFANVLNFTIWRLNRKASIALLLVCVTLTKPKWQLPLLLLPLHISFRCSPLLSAQHLLPVAFWLAWPLLLGTCGLGLRTAWQVRCMVVPIRVTVHIHRPVTIVHLTSGYLSTLGQSDRICLGPNLSPLGCGF